MLANLYKMGFLVATPIHMKTATRTFWNCFKCALVDNKKSQDGKCRILSIIADDFSYSEMQSNLEVREY